MNSFSKFCLAGLVCAVIAAGTLVANASASLGDRAHTTLSASSAGTMVALNPQPLPPGDREDEDYFRG